MDTCTKCSKPSGQHCIRCAVPYCSRACQVEDWPSHKLKCGWQILIAGISSTAANFGHRLSRETQISPAITVLCNPHGEWNLVAKLPQEKDFVSDLITWLCYRERIGATRNVKLASMVFNTSKPAAKAAANGLKRACQWPEGFTMGQVSTSTLPGNPARRLIQFSSNLMLQGDKIENHVAKKDTYESALLVLSEWESHLDEQYKLLWIDQSVQAWGRLTKFLIDTDRIQEAQEPARVFVTLSCSNTFGETKDTDGVLLSCAQIFLGNKGYGMAFVAAMKVKDSENEQARNILRQVRPHLPIERLNLALGTLGLLHGENRRKHITALPCTEQRADGDCVICLDCLLENVVKTKCGHFFHDVCIDTWRYTSQKNGCPVCKELVC
ncbi:hypothetical protein EDB80DRAFT_742907 [Ilyonectria destructans]|nr:hypothetical protein EDB80DRAFT_742907 [Ilyonectria destructans]